jgi:hypothetical protein
MTIPFRSGQGGNPRALSADWGTCFLAVDNHLVAPVVRDSGCKIQIEYVRIVQFDDSRVGGFHDRTLCPKRAGLIAIAHKTSQIH